MEVVSCFMICVFFLVVLPDLYKVFDCVSHGSVIYIYINYVFL